MKDVKIHLKTNQNFRNFSKEAYLIGFYWAYILASILMTKFVPGGPCTPGPGYLMYVALIPVNLALFIYHFVKFIKDSNAYWKLLVIDLLVWPVVLTLSYCNFL